MSVYMTFRHTAYCQGSDHNINIRKSKLFQPICLYKLLIVVHVNLALLKRHVHFFSGGVNSWCFDFSPGDVDLY